MELYYEDLEPANALGSKATIHKLGIFYITILNLSDFFNSSQANHHLVALAYTQDLKHYGYANGLEQITADLLLLENEGILVEINGKEIQVFGSLGTVNGDSLAQHTLFGLFESFRAIHFCERCMARNDEIQYLYHEDDFETRDPKMFDQQIKVLQLHCNLGRTIFPALYDT